MIYDLVRQLPFYRGLSAHLDRAIEIATTQDLAAMTVGKHTIDGDNLYAAVHEYETKQPSAAKWEAHRKYVDLQVIVRGRERMDVAPLEGLTVATPHDDATDNAFYAAPGSELAGLQILTVSAGEFAIFLPHDVHAPTLTVSGEAEAVKKVVFKVLAWNGSASAGR